jgi:hypothetical protein
MPLDFHAPTKEYVNLQVLVTGGFRSVEDSREQCWSRTPSLVPGRRRLVGGPRFECLESNRPYDIDQP